MTVIGVRFKRVGKIYYFDPGDLEANKSDGFLRWLGADKEELRELYRQEIAKFMPKQKAAKPETSKKPGKAKTE